MEGTLEWLPPRVQAASDELNNETHVKMGPGHELVQELWIPQQLLHSACNTASTPPAFYISCLAAIISIHSSLFQLRYYCIRIDGLG